jgi:hypothetical protein
MAWAVLAKNELHLQVRSEVQQLFARELLAYHNLSALVKPNQMKDCLAEAPDLDGMRCALVLFSNAALEGFRKKVVCAFAEARSREPG